MKSTPRIVGALSGLVLAVVTIGCGGGPSVEETQKLKAIVDEVKPMLKDWTQTAVFNGPIKGKCLIWWLDEDRFSAASWHSRLPQDMRASSSDKQVTVVLYSERGYVRGVGHESTTVDIFVIYWPEREAAGTVAMSASSGTAGLPPVRASGQESYMVPHIADWAARQPRQ